MMASPTVERVYVSMGVGARGREGVPLMMMDCVALMSYIRHGSQHKSRG